jgi:hypothetical protein
MFTDPPRLAEGVEAVYINYSKIGIHFERSNKTHGWIWVNKGGSLNLTSLVDIAQTIASLEIDSNVYVNIVRFNITGAVVTYNDKNYTAYVHTENLTVPIIGGLEVVEGSNALLLDIQPTVFNMGTEDEPFFVLSAVAKAYPVPREEVRDEMPVPGFKLMLKDRLWWHRLRQMHASSIEISSATLSSDSLKITVQNKGEGDVMLRLVIVAPLYTLQTSKDRGYIPKIFVGAAIFLIKEDGTLQPLQLTYKQNMGEEVKSQLLIGRGYKLMQGSTAHFEYIGKISFEYGIRLRGMPTPTTSGNKYLVAVIGDGVADSIVVEAK